jgi:hypothetical protein
VVLDEEMRVVEPGSSASARSRARVTFRSKAGIREARKPFFTAPDGQRYRAGDYARVEATAGDAVSTRFGVDQLGRRSLRRVSSDRRIPTPTTQW